MKKNLLFICGVCYCVIASAQTAGDYRSNGTSTWDNVATWQRFDGANWVAASTAPSSSDGVISILDGDSVTANTNITADQVIVKKGGTLIISTATFTLKNGPG